MVKPSGGINGMWSRSIDLPQEKSSEMMDTGLLFCNLISVSVAIHEEQIMDLRVQEAERASSHFLRCGPYSSLVRIVLNDLYGCNKS